MSTVEQTAEVPEALVEALAQLEDEEALEGSCLDSLEQIGHQFAILGNSIVNQVHFYRNVGVNATGIPVELAPLVLNINSQIGTLMESAGTLMEQAAYASNELTPDGQQIDFYLEGEEEGVEEPEGQSVSDLYMKDTVDELGGTGEFA